MKKLFAFIVSLVLILSFAGCSAKSGGDYKLDTADKAKGFYNTCISYTDKYGEASEKGGALYGASVVRLYDFTGDGTLELLVAYSSEKDGKTDSVMVCGFDMGTAELYNEKITSASVDQGTSSLWIYTDRAGLSYLVLGEDLSKERTYLYYRYADENGKALYSFAEAFTTDGNDLGGTYEKIELSGGDCKAVFEENDRVMSALKSQKN